MRCYMNANVLHYLKSVYSERVSERGGPRTRGFTEGKIHYSQEWKKFMNKEDAIN